MGGDQLVESRLSAAKGRIVRSRRDRKRRLRRITIRPGPEKSDTISKKRIPRNEVSAFSIRHNHRYPCFLQAADIAPPGTIPFGRSDTGKSNETIGRKLRSPGRFPFAPNKRSARRNPKKSERQGKNGTTASAYGRESVPCSAKPAARIRPMPHSVPSQRRAGHGDRTAGKLSATTKPFVCKRITPAR